MKQLSLVFALVMMVGTMAFGQRIISGTITDENGPLPYANVIVKGTTIGTTTDLDGKYELKVPEGASTVVVSYTGFTTQEMALGSSNSINVVLSEGVILEEAVVTALGIKRDKKSLGYAAQEVDGSELTKVKDANFINSLSGKVAGVDIARSSTLGGSSNVVIRGYTSITGNNQALFVVDGTPISNSNTNTTDQKTGRGGYDYGNAAADLNPEDIESVTVLRGAAATALYGSRGASGVILITTKKGAKGKKLGVTLSSGVIAGNIDKTTMPTYQKEYGAGYSTVQGWYQSDGDADDPNGFDYWDPDGDGVSNLTAAVYEDASFGPAFDPSLEVYDWRSYYSELGTYGQTFPWKAAENDATSFYKTSLGLNNSIAIDGGGDDANFRLSYTNFDQSGVIPNSRIKRNTLSFAGGYDVTEKWSANVSASYIRTNGQGRYGTGYDNRNVNQSFRQWYQTNVDIQELKQAYETTGKNISWNPYGTLDPDILTQPHYFDNYYFNVYENLQTDERNRMLGNTSLTYKVTDWLDITGRVSMDRYDELQEERIAVGSVDVPEYQKYTRDFTEMNYDLLLGINKYFGADDIFNFSGNLGTNIRRTTIRSEREQTNGGLVVPGVYSLSNSKNTLEAPDEFASKVGVNGYFARTSIGYNNMLYLDLTGRYDVSSTLPKGDNAYFYPSASVSFVFSELLDSKAFSFGKLRFNYAEVGNDAPFASLTDTYFSGTPFAGLPLASAPGTANNLNLEPERTKSFEVGVELNFLQNRVGLDVSAYRSNTYNQIFAPDVTAATGSSAAYVNAGNIQNQGLEVGLKFTPVKTKAFSWDMGINWAANQNEVKELFGDVTNIELGSAQGGISVNATIGEPYGAIWGTNYIYHDEVNQESPIVYPHWNGGVRYRKTSDPEVIGNINPDWKAGITNGLTYKDVSLSFLIDIQKGGDFFSLDTWYGYATGIYDNTAGTNDLGNAVRDNPEDGGGIKIEGAVSQATDAMGNLMFDADGVPVSNGEANTEYGYASDVYSSFAYVYAPNAMHVYDASYVKLREMALSYSLPAKMFNNIAIDGIDLSLVGRNLWIIHKNSPHTDPEAGLSAGNVRGNQSGAYPSVREFGVNLKVKF